MYWVREFNADFSGKDSEKYTCLLCDSLEEFLQDTKGVLGAPCIWDAAVGKLSRQEARAKAAIKKIIPLEWKLNSNLSSWVIYVMKKLGAIVSATVTNNFYGIGREEGMREFRELVIYKNENDKYYTARTMIPGYESIFDGTINKESCKNMETHQDYIYAYFDIASAYYENHDYEQAIKNYSHVLELNPLSMEAYYRRGGNYYMKHDIDNAIADLNQALSITPDYTPAKELLKRIQKDVTKKTTGENNMTKSKNDFDNLERKQQFEAASKRGHGERKLRAVVFQNTVKLVQNGGYYVNDIFVKIPNKLPDDKTEFFDAPEKLDGEFCCQTEYAVFNADCLETAELLLKAGLNPCVLNLASRQNPGGLVIHGSGAQEENLFRRTNLFLSLYQFAGYAHEYELKKHEKSYPLDRNTGGIYSAGITVFRGSEKNGYCLLNKPYTISVVTVPAINTPELTEKNGQLYIVDRLVEPSKEKIRTILRISGKYKHDCLVLGAFGCGVYKTPPNHVAELFKEVFLEKEFSSKFKLVVFAILQDHNSNKEHNPVGNVFPFLDVFNDFDSNAPGKLQVLP